MKKENFFLIIIILWAVFLRFYKLKDLFFFMVDESTVSLVAKRIVVDRRPVLIGTDIPGGLQTGPLFYYLTALIMLVSKMNPLGEAIFASGLGVIITGLIFFVSKKFFSSSKTAWLTAIFYTFSCLMIVYNRIYNSLTYSMLAAILAYYSLFQISKNKKNYDYLLSFALILGTHSEGTGFSLVLLAVLFFIFCRFPNKKVKALKVFIPFLASFLSLVVFDLRHNFVLWGKVKTFFSIQPNTGFNILESGKEVINLWLDIGKVFSRIFVLTGDPNLSCQILPCEYCIQQTRLIFNPFLLVFCLLMMFFFFTKIWQKKLIIKKIVGFHLVSMLIGLMFYRIFMPGYFHEWLLAIFFPTFFLIAGYFFTYLWKRQRFITVIFLGFFLLTNIKTFFSLYNPTGLSIKEKAVKYALNQVEKKDFYLDSLGECYGYGGYRYLYWFYGQAPSHSYVDNLYADWLYPLSQNQAPGLGVVMVSPTEQEDEAFYQRYNIYKNKAIDQKQFGKIEVLIVKDD